MNKLWNYIDGREFSDEGKIRVFLFLICVFSGVVGLIAWLIIRNFTLNTFECALCFVGYPAFIGYIGGFIYLCKNNER